MKPNKPNKILAHKNTGGIKFTWNRVILQFNYHSSSEEIHSHLLNLRN